MLVAFDSLSSSADTVSGRKEQVERDEETEDR